MCKIDIVPVLISEKEILRNLLEKYDYEFSQYDNRDVNELGLYGYNYLDYYWTEDGRTPFFIKVEGKLAGFIMVGNYMEVFKEADYNMSEFFVMYKYRRMGIGKVAAFKVFDMFAGIWELRRHPKNLPSVHFWERIIDEYTRGNFKKIDNCKEALYDDGSYGAVYRFTTSK